MLCRAGSASVECFCKTSCKLFGLCVSGSSDCEVFCEKQICLSFGAVDFVELLPFWPCLLALFAATVHSGALIWLGRASVQNSLHPVVPVNIAHTISRQKVPREVEAT